MNSTKFGYTCYTHSTEFEAVEVEDDTIKEWIERGIAYLKEHPSEKSHYIRSGNALVVTLRYSYHIWGFQSFVCKNYDVLNIPFMETVEDI